MTRDRQGALLITIGSVAMLTTMGLHPTGADVVHEASAGAANWLVRGVHGLAIMAMPLLGAGMAYISWRLRARALLAGTAWLTFLLAICAVLVAAVASGFLAPAAAARAARLAGAEQQMAMELFHYTGTINQAFAKVYVGLSALAIALWSTAMRGHPVFSGALAVFGWAVAAALGVGVGSGHLQLNVHGFGMVVIAQVVWMLWAAWGMRHIDESDG